MGVRQSAISPKFEKGLKEGKYVHKTHYLCPWNTRVLYGEGRMAIWEQAALTAVPSAVHGILKRRKSGTF